MNTEKNEEGVGNDMTKSKWWLWVGGTEHNSLSMCSSFHHGHGQYTDPSRNT
jgi:hypothetical protein